MNLFFAFLLRLALYSVHIELFEIQIETADKRLSKSGAIIQPWYNWLLSLAEIQWVLEKAGSAKVLEDMCEIIQK